MSWLKDNPAPAELQTTAASRYSGKFSNGSHPKKNTIILANKCVLREALCICDCCLTIRCNNPTDTRDEPTFIGAIFLPAIRLSTGFAGAFPSQSARLNSREIKQIAPLMQSKTNGELYYTCGTLLGSNYVKL